MSMTNKLSEEEVYVYIALRRVSKNKNENTGLTKKSYRLIRYHNQTEDEIVDELGEMIQGQSGLWRIYRTVNKRSLPKAYRRMQIEMLEKEDSVIRKVNSHWKSILMKHECKIGRKLLFDFDLDDAQMFDEFMNEIIDYNRQFDQSDKTEPLLVEKTQTPNGFHIVTNSFNSFEFKQFGMSKKFKDIVEIKTDALFYVGSFGWDEGRYE